MKKQKNKTNLKFKMIMELFSIYIMFFSVFSFISNFTENVINEVQYDLFGNGKYLFPIILFLFGFLLFLKGRWKYKEIKRGLILLIILFVFLISLFHSLYCNEYCELNYKFNGGILGEKIACFFISNLGFEGVWGKIVLIFTFLFALVLYLMFLGNSILEYFESLLLKLSLKFIVLKTNMKNFFKYFLKLNNVLVERLIPQNRKLQTAGIQLDNLEQKQDIDEIDPEIISAASADQEANIDDLLQKEEFNENKDDDEALCKIDKQEKVRGIKKCWKLPSMGDWLDEVADKGLEDQSLGETKVKLEKTLKNFNVAATVTHIERGASVTRFELSLEPGVKVSKIIGLKDDIALSLAAKSVLIEAPIPGKSAVGIEIPNEKRLIVPLRKILESKDYERAKGQLIIALGESISGKPIVADLVKMPHLLIAGTTGSGKSICLHTIITTLISSYYPEELKLIFIDMKRVELTPYNDIPHLITPVVQDSKDAASALKWTMEEMDRRYKKFAKIGVRNIDNYNQIIEDENEILPKIVVIIDELADLMMMSSSLNIEHNICRIAQLSRATGIHMILATQRPDVKIITGTIKANFPSRISFAVATQTDSRVIIDSNGAECLLGKGDMLFLPVEASKPIRIQGAFVSDREIEKLVRFWKKQGNPEYNEEVIAPLKIENNSEESLEDDEFKRAVQIVITTQRASVSLLQRKLRIGYNKAARLVEMMEEKNIVSPYDGVKPREVLLTSVPSEYL